ncbi:S8 family serine peptidase [bacterium]|nr:S8 family serine peptidase [bacterium]
MRISILPIIAVIALAFSAISEDDPTRWAPGMVLIEVEQNEFGDPIIDNDGFVTTGWPELDLICRDLGIEQWQRIIPIAPNPEYRRRWHWVERWFQFYFDPDVTDVPTAVEALRDVKGVKIVEPNFRGSHCATPNDMFYLGHQWYVRKVGADRVWDFTQGDTTIILSAVDSGVDYIHEDLTNLIWQNLGEDLDGDGIVFIPGEGFDPDDIQQLPDSFPDSTWDTDGNGYIDDFIGYDFVTGVYTDAYRHPTDPLIKEDGLDYDNDPNDFRYNGHGTHCTGTMAAEANNHIGIAGITWHTQIMCLRAGYYSRDCNGYNQNDAVLRGLQYGVSMGCRIFNFSYGGDDSSHFVHAIIDTIVNDWGALITAAAGNDDTDLTHYPSAYPEVIAIAATNQSDQKTYFSNYSPTVDISSPGIDIGATVPTFYECPPAPCDMGWSSNFASGYADFQGTSMAAPVVAGCAALLWSFFPDSSNHWIRNRLEDYTDYIYDVHGNGSFEADSQLGTGRINVFKALAAGIFPSLTLTEVAFDDENANGRPEPDEEVVVTLTYENSNDPTWAAAVGVELTVTTEDTLIIMLDSMATIGTIPRGSNGSNDTDPIVFKMDPAYRYGHYVNFDVKLTTPDRYILMSTFRVMVGYPELLVASVDTTFTYINKVMGSLRWGGVPYDSVYIPEGLSTEIMNRHRAIIYLTGDVSGMDVLPGSIESDLETWLTAEGGRFLMLTGQDLPEMATPSWLTSNFGAQHEVDVVALSLVMNLKGVDGDIIGDGIEDNIAFGGGSAVNQRFMGSCSAIGDGIPMMYYDAGDLADSTCAVRYESPTGWKSMLLEFGIEGLSDSIRCTFLDRALNWANISYIWDVPEQPIKPYTLKLMPPFPNPFNSAVAIGFDIPEPAKVDIDIFDLSGRLVRNFSIPEAQSGPNIIRWDAKLENGDRLPTGTYLYRVSALGKHASSKIIYVK